MGTLTTFDRVCMSIDDIKRKYNQTTFVETGCLQGESILFMMLKEYDTIFSCDINNDLVEYTINFLKQYRFNSTVRILNKNSVDFLEFIVPNLPKTESVFFFLDAHLPHFYDKTDGDPNSNDIKISDVTLTEKFEINFPLEKELDVIYKYRKGCRDFIVCDDARVYMDSNWVNGNWEDRKLFEGLNFEFLAKYKDEYDYTISFDQDGWLILTNKEKQ